MEIEKLENDQVIIAEVGRGGNIIAYAGTVEITTAEDEGEAVEMLSAGKKILEIIDTRRKVYTDPMNRIIKAINASAKAFSEPLDAAMSAIKGKMNGFHAAQEEAKRREEEKLAKKIEKAVAAGKPVPVMPTMIVDKTVRTETGKATYRDNWIAKILDKRKAIDYLLASGMENLIELDQSGLNRLAKNMKDNGTIPGCQIVNEKILSVS